MDIVVTDLTSFPDGRVCIAGIDGESGDCVRPLPYLTREACRDLGIEPGCILRGRMKRFTDRQAPHMEDHHCPDPRPVGRRTPAEFLALLEEDAGESVCDGFACEIESGEHYIPRDTPPGRSIITLRVGGLRLVLDRFGKLRAHVREPSGREFAFLPVADLLLREYIFGQEDQAAACRRIDNHVQRQEAVFCRVGVGRPKRLDDGRDGYWLQVNGVYSFPTPWREGVAAAD